MPFLSKPLLDRVFSTAHKSMPDAARQLREISIKSFLSEERFEIFLSHRFVDADYILSLYETLESFGYRVFVDWIISPELDRSNVTGEIADELRRAMKQSNSLLFVVSSNSGDSKWMPWELGYSDALHGKVAIIPMPDIETKEEAYEGQEYLSLYPYVTINRNSRGDIELLVNEAIDKFVSLTDWLKGQQPKQHSLFTKALRELYGSI